jgi:S-adenosylmethionine hydrolase
VLLGINPRARLVDLTHGIPAQDVLQGAIALEGAYRYFPAGTVHLAVVDPGVGTARRPLALWSGGHFFVGPDNGLFTFALHQPGTRIVASSNPRYRRSRVSRTFHARDIFAPSAAYLSRGVALTRLGPPVSDPVRLDWPRPRLTPRGVDGQVIRADRFGNLLTNVGEADLPGPGRVCRVAVGGRSIGGLVGTYRERPRGALGALIDSTGRLEVFVRQGSARARLGLGPGAPVRVRFSSVGWPRPPRTRTIPARTRTSR